MNKQEIPELLYHLIINSLLAVAIFLLVFSFSGCAANHCRADQRMPEGATFDDLKDMTREQCK